MIVLLPAAHARRSTTIKPQRVEQTPQVTQGGEGAAPRPGRQRRAGDPVQHPGRNDGAEPSGILQMATSSPRRGNRSARGAQTQQILGSVIQTARLRDLDPSDVLVDLLRAPPPIASPALVTLQ